MGCRPVQRAGAQVTAGGIRPHRPRQRGRRHGHHVPDLPIRRGRRGCHCPRPSTPDVGITIGSKKVMGQQMALSDVFD